MTALPTLPTRTAKPLPGELKLAKAFWPVLPAYARNLLVGTDVAERRDDEGGLVVAGLPLFTNAVDGEVDDLARDKLFTAYFGTIVGSAAAIEPELENRLAALGPLTPGDFDAVARRVSLTGEVRCVKDALRLLGEEVALRSSEGCNRPVGFAVDPPERRESPWLAEAAALERRASPGARQRAETTKNSALPGGEGLHPGWGVRS